MSDASQCCPKPDHTGSKLRVFTFMSAISAASLAGVGCLSCLPIIGAALATSSIATLLDDHLLGLQIGLLGISLVFSGFYFLRRRPGKWPIFFALAAYLALFLNALYFDKRALAITSLVVLLASHVWKAKVASHSVQLLYFERCPNLPVLKAALKELGVEDYVEIDLEKLETEDPLKAFSSPALLYQDEPIIGTRTSNASLSCSLMTKSEMIEAIQKAGIAPAKAALNQTKSI